jgi:FkbM family methyltransferase
MAPEITPEGTPDTSEDAFLGGKLILQQPKSGYRAGLDAVFLAACVPIANGMPMTVLDVGAGVGTVGLCVAVRCAQADVTLLERDPRLVTIARRNIRQMGAVDRTRIVAASVGATAAQLTTLGLKDASFDHVAANPPFHAVGRGTSAPDALKAASHAMPADSLSEWIRFLARMAKPGGTATVIHKAEALPQLLAAFAGRFGALHVLPLHPRAGEPASRVIVQGIKGSRAPLVLCAGFVLHGEGNAFTPQAQAVLRDGAVLLLR